MTIEVAHNVCAECGQPITLISSGLHYKWVTDPTRAETWHCGSDPLFPVKAHAPKEGR
jgi:hypothetical protein